jgi:hypothetical protein
LSGADSEKILKAVEIAVSQPANWTPPREYTAESVSQTVLKILLGYNSLRRHVS